MKLINIFDHSAYLLSLQISSDDGKIKFWVPMNTIPDDVEKLIIKATALNYPGNKTTGMKQPIA